MLINNFLQSRQTRTPKNHAKVQTFSHIAETNPNKNPHLHIFFKLTHHHPVAHQSGIHLRNLFCSNLSKNLFSVSF